MSSAVDEHAKALDELHNIGHNLNQSNIVSVVKNMENSRFLFYFVDGVSYNDNDNCCGDRTRLRNLIGMMMGSLRCYETDLKEVHGLLAVYDHKGILTSVWDSLDNCRRYIKTINYFWMLNHETEEDNEAIYYDKNNKPIEYSN